MGNKSKTKKLQRKDTFYYRAKDAGYRSRAAFKLIQLNKKYNFLQSSRVCIDLCAAPGSWMQVCTKFMPQSSLIVGVDLFRIDPLYNAISIKGDITTETVRQNLKANLKSWKADLVLHDGSPRVGKDWLHDAYQQNLLVLHAFRLACEFLQKGGVFVTKIFRSKDHLSLQYVFRKLFRKVEATKPTASRFESAEIFVVCQGFIAPDKVDSEFFDPKYVFQTVEHEPKDKISVSKPAKVRKKAEGYEKGITVLFKKRGISEFINATDHIELLETTNMFEWDMPFASQSQHTTSEIVEIVKDIKVLGKRELRALLNWRKAIKEEIEEEEAIKKEKEEVDSKEEIKKEEGDDEDDDLEELKKIQEEITKLKESQDREDKTKRRKYEKMKRKLLDRSQLRLMVPGDPGPQETQMKGIFSLDTLDKSSNLDGILNQSADILAESASEGEGSDTESKKKKLMYYKREGTRLDITGTYHKTSDDSDTEDEEEDEDEEGEEGLQMDKEEEREKKKLKKVHFDLPANEDSDEDQPDDDTGKVNPLKTDLVGDIPTDRRERKMETWFSQDDFGELEEEDLQDYELDFVLEKFKEDGGILMQRKDRKDNVDESAEKGESSGKRKLGGSFSAQDAPDSDSDDSGVDSDDDSEEEGKGTNTQKGTSASAAPSDQPKKKVAKLDNISLALATKMIHSKKVERDMYDASWNRYMWGDEKLPDWFAKDEKMYNSPQINVDKEDLKMIQEKNKAVDSKTMKKVIEAKARKQRRTKKRLKKARKLADAVLNSAEMTAREKASEVQKIYKKCTKTKAKEKKYVVMKKTYMGKKPKGAKGAKMVDKRLKKDKRASQKNENKKGKQRRPGKMKGKKK